MDDICIVIPELTDEMKAKLEEFQSLYPNDVFISETEASSSGDIRTELIIAALTETVKSIIQLVKAHIENKEKAKKKGPSIADNALGELIIGGTKYPFYDYDTLQEVLRLWWEQNNGRLFKNKSSD